MVILPSTAIGEWIQERYAVEYYSPIKKEWVAQLDESQNNYVELKESDKRGYTLVIPQMLDSRKYKLICRNKRQISFCMGRAEKQIATTA